MPRAQVLRMSALLIAGATSTAVLPRQTVWAEAPKDDLPEKKPIYSGLQNAPTTPKPAMITDPLPKSDTPTPTDRLQVQVKHARLFLHDQSLAAEKAFNSALTWAFKKETAFADTIASLAPAPETGEQLLPGAIYVLVATMAGSIVSRNRNILIRATFPAIVGITAGWMLIPVTMQNTSDLIWEYEKRVPAIAETHTEISKAVKDAWRQTKLHSQAAVKKVDQTAGDSRKTIERWVGEGR